MIIDNKTSELAFFHLKKSNCFNELAFELNDAHPDLSKCCPNGHRDSVFVRDSISPCCCKSCVIPFDYEQNHQQQRNYALALYQSSRSRLLEHFEITERERALMEKKASHIFETLPLKYRKPIDLALIADVYQRQAQRYEQIGDDSRALKNDQRALERLEKLKNEQLESSLLGQIVTVQALLQAKIVDLQAKLDYKEQKLEQALTKAVKTFESALAAMDQINNKEIYRLLQQELCELYLKAFEIFEKRDRKEKAIEYFLCALNQAFPQGKPLEKFKNREHKLYDLLPALFRLEKQAQILSKEKMCELLVLYLENCLERFGYGNDLCYMEDFLKKIVYGAGTLIALDQKALALSWLDQALETAKKVYQESELGNIKYSHIPLAAALYAFSRLYHQAGNGQKEREILEKAIEMLTPSVSFWHNFSNSIDGDLMLALLYGRLALLCLAEQETCQKAAEKSLSYCIKFMEKTPVSLEVNENDGSREIHALFYLAHAALARALNFSSNEFLLNFSLEDDKLPELIERFYWKKGDRDPDLFDESQDTLLACLDEITEGFLSRAEYKKLLAGRTHYEGCYGVYDELKAAF